MSFPRTLTVLAITLVFSPLFSDPAAAQFFPGRIALPQYDFTWTWGDEALARGGFQDLNMFGNEGGFRCELMATMRPGSRLSRQDVRRLENDIRDNLYFVQAAAMTMYMLESRSELGYATLACAKPEARANDDEEARARREARALERAARERERRRARRARQEADDP